MDLISTTDLELMQNLCEAFPYAGLFALSLLEGLHKTDDIRLNAMIAAYAYRIQNRSKLYTLLHTPQPNNTILEDLPAEVSAVDRSRTAPGRRRCARGVPGGLAPHAARP